MGIVFTIFAEVFGIICEEQPAFEVVSSSRAGEFKYDVREYTSRTLVEAYTDASGDDRSDAFNRLAKYIGVFSSPANATSTPVSMTAPVVMAPSKKSTQEMIFVLPSEFTLATAPKPTDPMVSLRAHEPKKLAVHRFSGFLPRRDDDVLAKVDAFKKALELEGRFVVKGSWSMMGYNPPFTIPFLRRNEIAWEVE